jgi:hypothetical protein
MDIFEQAQGIKFQPIEHFSNEQEFYAQVADSEMYRVPHGSREQLLTAMGCKHLDQLRQYRRLLRLPKEVWLHADLNNIPERRLRKHSDTVNLVTQNQFPDPLADEDYKRLYHRIWRHMTAYKAVYRGDINRLRAWLDSVEQSELVVD